VIGRIRPRPDEALVFSAAARFREFEEAAARFAREIRERCAPASFESPTASAQLNVELARTVFGKWSIEILSILYGLRSLGFEEVRRQLEGVTPRILSEKLKRLEANGLVERRVESTRPPRVRYALTRDGLTVAKLGEPVMLFLRLRSDIGPSSARRTRLREDPRPEDDGREETGARLRRALP
jgi:DNA-binding HxlR family transcriptional regulator